VLVDLDHAARLQRRALCGGVQQERRERDCAAAGEPAPPAGREARVTESLLRSSSAAAEDAEARAARMKQECTCCTRGDTSSAAIRLHNARSSEFGERSYPQAGTGSVSA
jgi:hypothetical protein